MKLYRGIKSKDFSLFPEQEKEEYENIWIKVLKSREAGNFIFPEEISKEVSRVHTLSKFAYQHFTDRKDIAHKYAKQQGGAVVEIEVPLEDIVDHFFLEFQNYAKRKESFEIVYIIGAKILSQYKDTWRLQVISV